MTIGLLLPVLTLLGSSCRSLKQPAISQQTKTLIKETLRDTVINIPADQSSFRAMLGTNDTGETMIKEVLHAQAGKQAKMPKVHIKDQILKVDCLCDSLEIYLKLKDTHITDMLKETVYVPTEKELSSWQHVQLWLGRVLLIGLAGGVIILALTKRII